MPWANRKYEGELKKQGDTVTVQTFPNVDFSFGGTAGDDIDEGAFTITGENLTADQVAQINIPIKDIEEIQSNLDLHSKVANRISFAAGQIFDKFVANLALQANSSNEENKSAPLVMTKGNVFEEIEKLRVNLSAQNAFGNAALFVSPQHASFLRQSGTLFDGFSEGLRFREGEGVASMNGVIGQVSGFTVFETNNLPFRQALTLDAQVTADDDFTITINGTAIVFTFKAAPSAAGEIDIGSDLATTQSNLIAAVTGGAGAGAAYIEVAAANRQLLRKVQIAVGAFASDIAFFSANQSITLAETFTDGGNIFGTAARVMFGVDREAINLVKQMTKLKVEPQPKAFRDNILMEMVYGGKVFDENAKRITTSDVSEATS